MVRFYSKFIKKGNLCLDIGAHKGNKTEIFLRIGAKVVAVEPQKECIDYLKQKFRNETRLILIQKGLSDKEEEIILHICEKATTISTFSDKWKTGRFSSYKWNKSIVVPVTTLDSLIKKFGLPDFCKIDVEGYEFKVLKGLSQPIPYISFEFTREFFNDAKSCINYLITLGYVKFNCSIRENHCLLFQPWVSSDEIYQKLDLIDDPLLWGDIYAKFT